MSKRRRACGGESFDCSHLAVNSRTHLQSSRRYVAIRWSSVAPRKKTGGKEASPDLDAAARQKPTRLIREDKTLAGIVLGEVDVSASTPKLVDVRVTFLLALSSTPAPSSSLSLCRRVLVRRLLLPLKRRASLTDDLVQATLTMPRLPSSKSCCVACSSTSMRPIRVALHRVSRCTLTSARSGRFVSVAHLSLQRFQTDPLLRTELYKKESRILNRLESQRGASFAEIGWSFCC